MTNVTETSEKWYNQTWLVILLYLFIFPVGLYALWKSSKIAKGWKIAGTALIGLFIIAAATGKPDTANQSNKPATASATSKVELTPDTTAATDDKSSTDKSSTNDEPGKSEKYLFESADDFKDAFNKYCTANSFDLSIDEMKVKKGEVQNSFQYMFTENLGILGSMDKSNGKVVDLMLMGSGDGTAKSGVDILTGIAALIATIDPSLSPEQRGQILKDLGLFGDKTKDITNLDGKTEMNGIKYVISSNKTMGLMFAASRK